MVAMMHQVSYVSSFRRLSIRELSFVKVDAFYTHISKPSLSSTEQVVSDLQLVLFYSSCTA
uniref:Uncharacterized protein n=1 Tax=Arion vulgaris TaxID=1028688 RepID=A0A0B7AJU7_9EUPU